MAKVKDLHIYDNDPVKLESLREEYVTLGRRARVVEPGHMVVYSMPAKYKRKVEREKRLARLRAARYGDESEENYVD